jgi:hypothetical protein
LRDEYTRTLEPARALAAQSLTLESRCAISSTWLWRSPTRQVLPGRQSRSCPRQKPTDEANRCELRH